MLPARTHTCNADEIARLCRLNGLTAEKLAWKAGIHAKTMKRLLSGKPAYIATLAAIAKVLKVPTDDLLASRARENSCAVQQTSVAIGIALDGVLQSPHPVRTLLGVAPHIAQAIEAQGIQIVAFRVQTAVAQADSPAGANETPSLQPTRLDDDYPRMLYLVRAQAQGKPAWYYVLVTREERPEFLRALSTGSMNLSDHGKVMASGWGQNPPEPVFARVKEACFGVEEIDSHDRFEGA